MQSLKSSLVAGAVVAALVIAPPVAAQAKKEATPGAASISDVFRTKFGPGVDSIEAWRIFTNRNGASDLEKVVFKGKKLPFFDDNDGLFKAGIKVDKHAVSFLAGRLAHINIYNAPADVDLPSHLSPGSEMFLILRGSATLILKDGRTQTFVPGDLVLFEDTTGSGRGGRIGPEGFTAVNFSFVTQGPASELAQPKE